MTFTLTAITILIISILYLTWLKDGEHMHPPLNRRLVIDLSIIVIFWILYGLYCLGGLGIYDNELALILNLALTFFLVRLCQLIGQLSGWFNDLMAYIKERKGGSKNE